MVVLDLPGCFSAGDNLDDAMDNAKEAISLWLGNELDAERCIPTPSPLEKLVSDPSFKGWVSALVNIDISSFSARV